MIRVLVAGRTEHFAAVGAAHATLCHVLGCLFGKKISLFVFLLIIDLRSCNLEVVAAFALDHTGLHIQVKLHSLTFNLLFVFLWTENLSDFNLRDNHVAVAAFWILEHGIYLALALVL